MKEPSTPRQVLAGCQGARQARVPGVAWADAPGNKYLALVLLGRGAVLCWEFAPLAGATDVYAVIAFITAENYDQITVYWQLRSE